MLKQKNTIFPYTNLHPTQTRTIEYDYERNFSDAFLNKVRNRNEANTNLHSLYNKFLVNKYSPENKKYNFNLNDSSFHENKLGGETSLYYQKPNKYDNVYSYKYSNLFGHLQKPNDSPNIQIIKRIKRSESLPEIHKKNFTPQKQIDFLEAGKIKLHKINRGNKMQNPIRININKINENKGNHYLSNNLSNSLSQYPNCSNYSYHYDIENPNCTFNMTIRNSSEKCRNINNNDLNESLNNYHYQNYFRKEEEKVTPKNNDYGYYDKFNKDINGISQNEQNVSPILSRIAKQKYLGNYSYSDKKYYLGPSILKINPILYPVDSYKFDFNRFRKGYPEQN